MASGVNGLSGDEVEIEEEKDEIKLLSRAGSRPTYMMR